MREQKAQTSSNRQTRRARRTGEREPAPSRHPARPESRRDAAIDALLAIALVAITAILYSAVARHGFVYVDDGDYILDNVHVARGLSWKGVLWAFTSFHSGNWHPLTWISHMIDASLFGTTLQGAGGHHLVSVAIHASSAVLLFLALRRMTGSRWTSALVAALFAVHPLRVESVAWASERKDVLSGLFFMLTLLAYARYAERPELARYLLVFLGVAGGLLAKPMLVTIPFVLMLLDLWPLGRWRSAWIAASEPYAMRPAIAVQPIRSLVLEKLPLLALCAVSSAATIIAQRRGNAVSDFSDLSLAWRLVEAPISYATYLAKTAWPGGLAFFHPHPATYAYDRIGEWIVPAALSGALLVVATAACAWKARTSPHLLVGWLWFLGMMLPVIGLLQVGTQAWAERYAYLPLIGIQILIAYAARDLASRHRLARAPVVVAAGISIAALAIVASRQVDAWRDTRALLDHAALVTRDNWLVHNDLGVEISRAGRLDEGRRHFLEALRIRPEYAEAHSNLGFSYFFEGRLDEARRECERALAIKPDHPEAHFVLACVLDRAGDRVGARDHFERALSLKPGYAEAHFRLGLTLRAQGLTAEARHHFEEALRLNPGDSQSRLQLSALLAESSRTEERDRTEAHRATRH